VDPAKEWQRLTDYYGERIDEELLELATDFDGLTEVARQVLRDELKKRGLPPPEIGDPAARGRTGTPIFSHPATIQESVAESEDTIDALRDYSWKVVLCECNEREDAEDLVAALERAGIESWYDGPSDSRSFSANSPRVLVGADDLEAAQRVMQQPIPQDIHDQTRTIVPDFETPNCAKCGALDPLLERVEPFNTWLCENCGARWTESSGGIEQR